MVRGACRRRLVLPLARALAGRRQEGEAVQEQAVVRDLATQVLAGSTSPERAKAATDAVESIDKIKTSPKLFAEAELPKDAAAIQPTTTPLQNIQFKTSDGKTMQVGPDGKISPAPEGGAPSPVPPSAPAPAPSPPPLPLL